MRKSRRGLYLLVLTAVTLLAGCETVNDAFVRRWLMDSGLSRKTSHQIREGLEKREQAPPATAPTRQAPPFLDQG